MNKYIPFQKKMKRLGDHVWYTLQFEFIPRYLNKVRKDNQRSTKFTVIARIIQNNNNGMVQTINNNYFQIFSFSHVDLHC